jgi:hypothetical protein
MGSALDALPDEFDREAFERAIDLYRSKISDPERHRRIRARSTTEQVAGAAIEKPGSKPIAR